MSDTIRVHPVAGISASMSDGDLVVMVYAEGERCVIQAAGELDLDSRNQLFEECTRGNHPELVIDLAAVTFMDCSGYGSLVASRTVVESTGRALTIRGQTGQPARLLELIAALERVDGDTVRQPISGGR